MSLASAILVLSSTIRRWPLGPGSPVGPLKKSRVFAALREVHSRGRAISRARRDPFPATPARCAPAAYGSTLGKLLPMLPLSCPRVPLVAFARRCAFFLYRLRARGWTIRVFWSACHRVGWCCPCNGLSLARAFSREINATLNVFTVYDKMVHSFLLCTGVF